MTARGVLECGSPLPLSEPSANQARQKSARGPAHSNTRRRFVALFALAALPLISALAQSYSVDWYKVGGGGGTSTGGVYAVAGTIGQPDAGAMSGGPFTLTGGFWGLIAAVQTPGAPLLSVTRSNSTVIMTWPLPATGWLLHATTNLVTSGSVWTEIPPPYQTSGVNLQFTEPSPAGNRFHRLFKP